MTRIHDTVVAVTCLTFAALAGALPAGAVDCTCRTPGGRVELGDTACLPTPKGPRLAQCVMDLNITSWKNLDIPCAMSAAPAAPMSRMASLGCRPATPAAAP